MEIKAKKNQIFLLLLPGLLIFSIFTILPILKLVYNSFLNWNMSTLINQSFSGLSNFKNVFSDNFFKIALSNTLLYTVVTVPLQMILGLLAAVLVNKVEKFSVLFRTLFYLPVLTSWVIASLVFRFVFNQEGLLNYLFIDILNISSNNINWLGSRFGGLTVAMILGTWKGIGWNMMVFLSALQNIPRNLYEASSLDGANSWQQFFKITLPSIKGTILFSLIMLTIGGFNVYTSIAMITGGGPAHETESLLSWMYYKAFQTGDFGYASALSIVISIILGILAIFQFRMMGEKNE